MQGPTWQQAVQWMEEVRVEPGTNLSVLAKHDTYSISFAWQAAQNASHSTDIDLDADTESNCPTANGHEVAGVGSCPNQTAVPLKVSCTVAPLWLLVHHLQCMHEHHYHVEFLAAYCMLAHLRMLCLFAGPRLGIQT